MLIAVILIGVGALCASVGLMIADSRLRTLESDMSTANKRIAYSILDGDEALTAAESILTSHESRLDALEASDRLSAALLRDVERYIEHMSALEAPSHAPCALCGKQGHVADMEAIGCADFVALRNGGWRGDWSDTPVHCHPSCLVSAGYEHVDAVAGGWRKAEGEDVGETGEGGA